MDGKPEEGNSAIWDSKEITVVTLALVNRDSESLRFEAEMEERA